MATQLAAARAGNIWAPASDVAAQTAAGLAMLAHYFQQSPYGSQNDKKALVPRLTTRAQAAYAYAKFVYQRDGDKSTCSRSASNNLCIGAACKASMDALKVCSQRRRAIAAHSVCVRTCALLSACKLSADACRHAAPHYSVLTSAHCEQPCQLYYNEKGPRQQLFSAAAALFVLTGSWSYRYDADGFYNTAEAFNFLYNWNNVYAQVRARAAGAVL
jgi:hypothetical protein